MTGGEVFREITEGAFEDGRVRFEVLPTTYAGIVNIFGRRRGDILDDFNIFGVFDGGWDINRL